ncbi:MAG: TIGR01458 family HAD-type hydrolase [Pseudomonadota bacterium]
MIEMPFSGLLLDMDGVLYIGNQLIPGALETLRELRGRGLPFRFITNTSTRTPAQLLSQLHTLGIKAHAEEIFTAVTATVQYLQSLGSPRCYFLVNDNIRSSFFGFREDRVAPDVIVIGDIGDRWNYVLLNDLFNMLMRGSKMVCLHRNRYWETEGGLCMDIGAFVAALEFVSGQSARVIGKPAPEFFLQALASVGLPPEQVAVVGDDIDSDIGGAQNYGLRGILVKTGKYREALVNHSGIRPDYVIDSIAELPAFLDSQLPVLG